MIVFRVAAIRKKGTFFGTLRLEDQYEDLARRKREPPRAEPDKLWQIPNALT